MICLSMEVGGMAAVAATERIPVAISNLEERRKEIEEEEEEEEEEREEKGGEEEWTRNDAKLSSPRKTKMSSSLSFMVFCAPSSSAEPRAKS